MEKKIEKINLPGLESRDAADVSNPNAVDVLSYPILSWKNEEILLEDDASVEWGYFQSYLCSCHVITAILM